jgi:hypothetical protein
MEWEELEHFGDLSQQLWKMNTKSSLLISAGMAEVKSQL